MHGFVLKLHSDCLHAWNLGNNPAFGVVVNGRYDSLAAIIINRCDSSVFPPNCGLLATGQRGDKTAQDSCWSDHHRSN